MHSSNRSLTAVLTALMLTGCFEEDTQPPRTIDPAPPVDFWTRAESLKQIPTEPPRLEILGPTDFADYTAGSAPAVLRLNVINPTDGETPITRLDYIGSDGIKLSHACPAILAPGQGCAVTLNGSSINPGRVNGEVLAFTDRSHTTHKVSLRVEAPPPPALPPVDVTLTNPPAPPVPPDRPPPPPPPAGPSEAELKDIYAAIRLSERMRAGPNFDTPRLISAPTVTQVAYNATDENYFRENTPSAVTGYPVDRTQILTMDRAVWGVLDREINSQLPGIVIVRIDEPVYGTDGLHKLLEKGDALLARYEPLSKQGDTRLNLCFFRIIRLADGAHVYNEDDDCFAYATDAMGRVGLVGEVDNRNFERYGTAFATALLTAVAQYGANTASESDPGLEAAGDALNDQFADITARVLEETVDLAPVITVSAAERVGIQFLRDIYIRRPKPLEKGAEQ
jgi:type IV secretion system protein VirB10